MGIFRNLNRELKTDEILGKVRVKKFILINQTAGFFSATLLETELLYMCFTRLLATVGKKLFLGTPFNGYLQVFLFSKKVIALTQILISGFP